MKIKAFFKKPARLVATLSILIAIPLAVYAVATAYYRLDSGQVMTIYEQGVCKKVTNNNAKDFFVPTNSQGEWEAFIANAPTDVALMDCNGAMLESSLVSYWDMDSNWNDAKGVNHGVVSNPWAGGKINGALTYDGVNDMAVVPDDGTFDFEHNNPFSVSMWFKTSSAVAQTLAGKGFTVATNPGYLVFIGATGGITVYMTANPFPTYTLTRSTPAGYNDGNWHHLTVSYDGSGVNTGIKIYMDGVQVGAGGVNTLGGKTILNNEPLRIGNRAAAASSPFLGSIDEVQVYNTALSQSDVDFLYNSGNGTASAASGAIANWHFDEAYGAVAADSISAKNANLTNFVLGPSPDVPKYGYHSAGFDGVNTFITVPHAADINFERTNSFSAEAWIKPNNFSVAAMIFGKSLGPTSYRGYMMGLNSPSGTDAKLTVQLLSTASTVNYLSEQSVSYSFMDGNWHHVAFTYDGSSTHAGLKLYIDGNEVSTTDAGTLTASILNTVSLKIGRREDGYYFNGLIDELAIYNSALPASTIQEHAALSM